MMHEFKLTFADGRVETHYISDNATYDEQFGRLPREKIYTAVKIVNISTGNVLKDRYRQAPRKMTLTDQVEAGMVAEHFEEDLFEL